MAHSQPPDIAPTSLSMHSQAYEHHPYEDIPDVTAPSLHNPYETDAERDGVLKAHPSGGESSYDTYRDEDPYFPSQHSFKPSDDTQDASLVRNAAPAGVIGGFRPFGLHYEIFVNWNFYEIFL